MKYCLLIFVVCLNFKARADYFSPELAARVTADMINNSATVKTLLNNMLIGLSASEVEGANKMYKKLYNEDTLVRKLPEATAVGNKVSFKTNKLVLEYKSDRSFMLDGNLYQLDSTPFDKYLEKKYLQKKMSSSLYNFFISQANAEGYEAYVGAGLLSETLKDLGRLAGGPAVVAWFGYSLYVHKEGSYIECDKQGRYVLYTPSWTITANQEILANHQIIDANKKKGVILKDEEAKAILKDNLTCTPATAKQMSETLVKEVVEGEKILGKVREKAKENRAAQKIKNEQHDAGVKQ